jgi:hypothetical protein
MDITMSLRTKSAASGMVLTNGESFSEIGGTIYLGCFDNPDNWYEITEEEYNTILEEQSRMMEEELNS